MAEEEYLCQGFLTKSPPEHKMNRARWQRRWFVLRVSDDKVTLDYFKDSSRSKLKGTILLSECQRVDQGLSFESKRKYHNAHIFDVVTPKRKYYLVTNSEEDMQRWVESICRACGFRSEDETSMSDTSSYRFRMDRASYLSDDNNRGGLGRLPSVSNSVRSEPDERVRESTMEPYIPLTNCATQGDSEMSQSLPRDFEAEFLERGNRASSSSGSSSSSLPDAASMSDPSHMYVKSASSAPCDVYDVPPVKQSLLHSIYENQRVSVKDPTSSQFEQQMSQVQDEARKDSGDDELESRTLPPRDSSPRANYDFVPARRPPPTPPEMDSVYDVPPVKPSLVKPAVPERTYPPSCIYDVPSSLTNDDSIYDIPPVPMPQEPPPRLEDAFEIKPLPQSDSTDELAKSLEQISMRNAEMNSAEAHHHQDSIYDVPPHPRNDSNPFSPSRPPVSTPQNAPPRPPKPPNLEGPPIDKAPVNPPYEFADDDPYVGSPGRNSTPLLSNGHSNNTYHPSPQGHHWLNHTVPTPRKYLNVRDTPSSKPPLQGSHPMPSPTHGYLLMQGANSSSNVFQYPDENYMSMEGSPDQAMEKSLDLYTAMDGNQPPPLPRMSSTSPASVFSDEREERDPMIPPPVDRSSKPGRSKTGSSISSIGSTKLASDSRGLSDSYYATDSDLGIPTRNSRTKSFSREGRLRSTNSPRGTPNMVRSNTVQYPPGSKPPLPHQSISMGDFSSDISELSEDTYMLHENMLGGERHSPDLSSSYPSQRVGAKDKIEYLEIAHDEESATSPPPSKPSKENNVEYITIDSEKTKALETIQQNREKSYKGS